MLWTIICKTANTKMERFEAAETSCYSHALNAVDTILLALVLYSVLLQCKFVHRPTCDCFMKFLLHKNL